MRGMRWWWAVLIIVLVLGGTTYTALANYQTLDVVRSQQQTITRQGVSLCRDSVVISDVVPIIVSVRGSPAQVAAVTKLRSDYTHATHTCSEQP